MTDFVGVKIALIQGSKLLAIKRDDLPGLRFAGLWDMPGGGREDDETPFECVAREVKEELGLDLAEKQIVWQKIYPSMHDPSRTAYFMVAHITPVQINNVVFGDEGQGWRMIPISEFLDRQDVVSHLKGRLSDYLAAQS